jgi:phasin family protein
LNSAGEISHAETKVQMADIAKPTANMGSAVKAEPAKPEATPVAVSPVAVKAPVAASAPVEPAKVEVAKVEAAKPEAKAKPAAAKPVTAKPAPTKTVSTKTVSTKTAPIKAAPKPVAAKTLKTKAQPKAKSAAPKPAPVKDTKIMTTTSTEITTKIQDAVKDAAAKAKTFAEKGQAGLGEVSEFAKGNVEAMVESTKILAGGIQEMGKGYVAEAKTAFETMTADAKDLASAKSPTEFMEKQTAIMKKNFDAAIAKSSKSSEAMLKLVNEAFQPLSTRMSLAMEKVKKAA